MTSKKVAPKGPIDGHSRAEAFRCGGTIPVSVMEPDQPKILDVVKDHDEDRQQQEILVGPLRLRVDGLEARHKEVDRSVQQDRHEKICDMRLPDPRTETREQADEKRE